MAESQHGAQVERTISSEQQSPCGHPKLSFASCVDSIKEGLLKLSGLKDVHLANSRKVDGQGKRVAVHMVAGSPVHPLQHSHGPALRPTVHGGKVWGIKRKRERKGGGGWAEQDGNGSVSSFEVFLSTIPKLDPVDRTLGWVYTQPHDEQDIHEDANACLHKQRSTLLSAGSSRLMESRGNVTSVSRCESERGTGGRGTPPSIQEGQPRLDEVFRQLQLQQEQGAHLNQMRVGAPPNTLLNLNVTNGKQAPAGTPFLPSYPRAPAALIHKNSFYYNQGLLPTDLRLPAQQNSLAYACEWQTCRRRFLTSKELLCHVEEEHIGKLPVRVSGIRRKGNTLTCQWRGCDENGSTFAVRYKLLLHIQKTHCRERLAQHKNANLATAQPSNAESDGNPSPPTASKGLRQLNMDSPSMKARKLPTRASINTRTMAKKVIPSTSGIPELRIGAHPVIAQRRQQSHMQTIDSYPSHGLDRPPER